MKKLAFILLGGTLLSTAAIASNATVTLDIKQGDLSKYTSFDYNHDLIDKAGHEDHFSVPGVPTSKFQLFMNTEILMDNDSIAQAIAAGGWSQAPVLDITLHSSTNSQDDTLVCHIGPSIQDLSTSRTVTFTIPDDCTN